MSAPRLTVPDAAERDDLAVFVARAVRLDPSGVVRLRTGSGHVSAWGSTPFDVLVTHGVGGTVEPADTTVTGSDLLAALSVVGGASVTLGTPVDERWRGPLPGPDAEWSTVGEVPGADVATLVERVVAGADTSGGGLDTIVLTVGEARVPARCVLALAGMGLSDAGGPVRVDAAGGWLRLVTPGGAVAHRRWRLALTRM